VPSNLRPTTREWAHGYFLSRD